MEQTTIIPLELSDGTIIRVEATPIGDQKIAFQKRPFKEATDAIKAIAKELSCSTFKLHYLSLRPHTVRGSSNKFK